MERLGLLAQVEVVGVGDFLRVLFGGAGALEDNEAGGVGEGEGAEEEGVGEGVDGGVGADAEGEGEDGDGGEGGVVFEGAEGVLDVFVPHGEVLLGGGAEGVYHEVSEELAGRFALGAAVDEFVHFGAKLGAKFGGVEAKEELAKSHGG
jgi:hypothetical protein